MSGSTKGANLSLPPPRRTGNDQADLLMQVRWFNDFYDQFVKVLDVATAINTLKAAGLLDAPSGWLTSVNNQLASMAATLTSLTNQVNNMQAALDAAGILPITVNPGLNATAIQLLVHNNGGVNLAAVTLTAPNGAGTGFRALVVPN